MNRIEMGELFVKICGITTLDDALAAVEHGADALGFNFYGQSKRYITLGRAAEIIERFPVNVLMVGVFVNPDREYVNAAIESVGITGIQFSGNESPEAVAGYHLPVIKAIHVANAESIQEMKLFAPATFLLDTFRNTDFGGTGEQFDLDIAVKAKGSGKVIIAGGLNSENVADAVRKVKPYGVDVSSGVELRPGVKDHKKIREFILHAREAHTSG
jgi:phosphoribosylanthranilate isomerase